MAKSDDTKYIVIPPITALKEEDIPAEGTLILVRNLMEVPERPDDLITSAGEKREIMLSGIPQDNFVRIMDDFATNNGVDIIAYEAGNLVMKGDKTTIEKLNTQCGKRFFYEEVDAKRLMDIRDGLEKMIKALEEAEASQELEEDLHYVVISNDIKLLIDQGAYDPSQEEYPEADRNLAESFVNRVVRLGRENGLDVLLLTHDFGVVAGGEEIADLVEEKYEGRYSSRLIGYQELLELRGYIREEQIPMHHDELSEDPEEAPDYKTMQKPMLEILPAPHLDS